jgi:hypothetical protein
VDPLEPEPEEPDESSEPLLSEPGPELSTLDPEPRPWSSPGSALLVVVVETAGAVPELPFG